VEKRFTRREFLKVSAQGAAAVGLTTLLGGLELPSGKTACASPQEDPAAWIDSLVKEFALHSPLNSLQTIEKRRPIPRRDGPDRGSSGKNSTMPCASTWPPALWRRVFRPSRPAFPPPGK
jgi:hypothetical protein